MDIEQIHLTRSELSTLKRSAKRHVPSKRCQRLLRLQLVEMNYEHIPGYQGRPLETCQITDKGQDYLIYKRDTRNTLWLESVWVPILVTVLTNIAIDGIKWLLPLIQEWLCHVL